MSLEYAVDRLYEVGWTISMGKMVQRLDDGRTCPTVAEVHREFTETGMTLSIRQVTLFNCYRAEWPDGYCVGVTEAEAAVYALAQLLESRRLVAV